MNESGIGAGAARHSLPAVARALWLPLGPSLLTTPYSVQGAGERAAAQIVVGVRLVVHEIRDGEGDLVVDLVVLRFDLRIDADVGDEEIGVRNAVGIDVLGQHGAVLDGKAEKRRATGEKRADAGLDVGLKPAEKAVELLG